MRPGYFNHWWLATVLGLCVLHGLIAVVADPYRVFGVIRYPKRNFEPNTRFLKVEYLRQHPEYDAYILGSSRASYYEAESARRFCGPQRRYFNLNASLENGAGIRRKLDWLARTRPVRQAIINVDFDLQSVPGDPLDLLRQDHPLISGSTATAFYAKYLLFQPRILYVYVEGQAREAQPETWNRGNRGMLEPLYPTTPPFDTARLLAITVGAVTADLSRPPAVQDRAAASGHEEFRRTVETLEQARVERIFIVPPYRLDQYAEFNIDAYTEWMRKIVSDAGQIWDFSGFHAVTADPRQYVDRIHFNEGVGDRILRRVCGGAEDGGGFGVRVTRANLDAHLAAHRRQHQAARASRQTRLFGTYGRDTVN